MIPAETDRNGDTRHALDATALDILFRFARSHNGWIDRPVTDDVLRRIYDIMKWGPTSANSSPARFLFLRTKDAKERLRPHLDPSNVDKAMTAPVTAIIGYDRRVYVHLPRLFPHNPGAVRWFAGEVKAEHAATTAFRNGTLQGAYFMLAARSVGLDCGPMSGFDGAGIDREFWSGTSVSTNFLCALGHGDPTKLYPRHPRLRFDEACTLL